MTSSQTLRVSDLDIPLFLLPHGFISNCNFCNKSIDLEYTLNQLVKCPYCSMILNSPLDDDSIISLMGGYKIVKKHLELLNQNPYSDFPTSADLHKRIDKEKRSFKERIYRENDKFQARLARQARAKNKGRYGGA